MSRVKKTDLDRAIESSEAKIKLEQEVLSRLQQAKKDAHAATLRRRDARAKKKPAAAEQPS